MNPRDFSFELRRLAGAAAMGLASIASPTIGAVGVHNDFNGDGFSDLAIGVPADNELAIPNGFSPGTVNVLYGSGPGLSSTGDQQWNANSPGIVGISRPTSQFGGAAASADFNGHGFADLAVGSPTDQEIVGAQNLHGVVTVIYGSETGLGRASRLGG
ncbi:MAG: FG-GAP repeat protein [Chromatiales bacterium]